MANINPVATDATQFVRPEIAREIIDELEAVQIEIMAWLEAWHRAAICRLEPPATVLAQDGHLMSRFGAWYEYRRNRNMVDQVAFYALAKMHRKLYAIGRDLALRLVNGQTISMQDYDLLMQRFNAFTGQARQIADTLRVAFSDIYHLTGVYNRRAMMEELERERERFMRTGQPCTLCLTDIDLFKGINDTYGHGVGDQVLAEVANRVLSGLRPYDSVFRYGGEEFLICLPNAGMLQARVIAERLRERLAEAPIIISPNLELIVTASFGLATMEPSLEIKEVMERADRALYQAKAAGRNCVRHWADLDEAARERSSEAVG
ncbi:MAG: diguanylate cyclase [Alphaproteobacteria bacterium]